MSGSYSCWYCGRSFPLPDPDNKRTAEKVLRVREVDNCSECGAMTIDEYLNSVKQN